MLITNLGGNKQASGSKNPASSADAVPPAGIYKPKVQVPRKPMGSHISSQYSTVNTSREKARQKPEVVSFNEYDTIHKKSLSVNSPVNKQKSFSKETDQ